MTEFGDQVVNAINNRLPGMVKARCETRSETCMLTSARVEGVVDETNPDILQTGAIVFCGHVACVLRPEDVDELVVESVLEVYDELEVEIDLIKPW